MVLLLWFILIVFVSPLPVIFDYLFNMFKVASWTSTGKELISWLFDCAAISLCRLDLFVFLSRMVSGEGCGIRLYQFLIIAFLSTMKNTGL